MRDEKELENIAKEISRVKKRKQEFPEQSSLKQIGCSSEDESLFIKTNSQIFCFFFFRSISN